MQNINYFNHFQFVTIISNFILFVYHIEHIIFIYIIYSSFIVLHLFITTIYIIYYTLLSQFTNFPITNYVASVEIAEHKSIVHNLSHFSFSSTTLSYATLPPTHNQSHHPQPFHLPTTSLPSHSQSYCLTTNPTLPPLALISHLLSLV